MKFLGSTAGEICHIQLVNVLDLAILFLPNGGWLKKPTGEIGP